MQDTKKVAGELLVELEKKGVTFETVDGKLKYKDSKGNICLILIHIRRHL